MIGLSLARVVARELTSAAASVEVVYDAQAAAQILGAKVHRQRHPVRRAIRKATTSSVSTEWWVQSQAPGPVAGSDGKGGGGGGGIPNPRFPLPPIG